MSEPFEKYMEESKKTVKFMKDDLEFLIGKVAAQETFLKETLERFDRRVQYLDSMNAFAEDVLLKEKTATRHLQSGDVIVQEDFIEFLTSDAYGFRVIKNIKVEVVGLSGFIGWLDNGRAFSVEFKTIEEIYRDLYGSSLPEYNRPDKMKVLLESGEEVFLMEQKA